MGDLETRGARVLAQGWTGTNSKRSTAYVRGVYPTHFVRGQGPHVWDEQGKKYVDFVCALGPVILGYAHPKVDEAAIRAIKAGGIFSLPSHLEVEVAELVADWLGIEKMRFFLNGDDATTAAVRIARTYTGTLPVYSSGYHGCSDIWTSLNNNAVGTPKELSIQTLRPEECAIAILECITLDCSETRRAELKGFKSKVRIFDEIVTGMRVPKYTVSKMWDIQPEMICLGKAIANGYPLSIVGGKEELMDCGDYFLSRTFASYPVSLAACQATIGELKKKRMDDLFYYAQRFCQKFNEICKPIGSNIVGYGTRGQTDLFENEKTALLFQELVKAGYFLGRAFYFNFAHLEANLEEMFFNVLTDCVGKVSRGEVKLQGERPRGSFKR